MDVIGILTLMVWIIITAILGNLAYDAFKKILKRLGQRLAGKG